MGRGKLKMELIENERSRILTLKKRREGLTKKLHQLATLCDIPACMIIYDPATNSSTIWPQDSDQVRRLIAAYNSKSNELGGVRSYGLSDFFTERQKQIDGELVKLRKKNLEAKYPTWDDSLCFMDEAQLRGLAAALRGKAQIVRSRIHFLKNMMLFNYPNLSQFYGLDPEIGAAATVTDMVRSNSSAAQLPVSVPNYYYYAPPPLPPAQPYMLRPHMGCSSMEMDENVNWWGDDGDDITRYLLH